MGAFGAFAKKHPAIAYIGSSIIGGPLGALATHSAIKSAKRAEKQQKDAMLTPASPSVGDGAELKPGQKVNAIYTSPAGVLESPSTARSTLLGGVR